jgi:hypothetical protein
MKHFFASFFFTKRIACIRYSFGMPLLWKKLTSFGMPLHRKKLSSSLKFFNRKRLKINCKIGKINCFHLVEEWFYLMLFFQHPPPYWMSLYKVSDKIMKKKDKLRKIFLSYRASNVKKKYF